jgi:hypothetical protein
VAGSHPVKVLSPEMLSLWERAQALCIAEGHTLRRENGERRGGARGRRPVHALPDAVTVTREIHAALRGSMPVRAEEARRANGGAEVGSPNSTDEAW